MIVMLSAAKHLVLRRERFFATLRMTFVLRSEGPYRGQASGVY